MAEDLLGRAVVDAVALSRHALDDARLLERLAITVVLVLHPMSECMTGLAASGIFASRPSSISFCCAMFADRDMLQDTISLLPKSYAGAK